MGLGNTFANWIWTSLWMRLRLLFYGSCISLKVLCVPK